METQKITHKLNSLLRVETLHKVTTELNADSLEWCPHKPFQNVFVCGNYQLEKSENSESNRNGRILLFTLHPDCGVTLRQTLNTAGVLDQKWCHNRIGGNSVLGVVNSDSKLEIYKFDGEKLEFLTSYCVDESGEVLLLSLDWSTGKYSSETPDVVCSDSKGSWHRFTFNGRSLELLSSCKTHDYEAWIAAFYYWDTNITFTGADDLKLNKYDQRVGCDPVATNKNHDAGVTCIHSNPQKEYIIASGSYDEFVRTWDIRNMKSSLHKQKLFGPVWRIKWNPLDFKHLLVACMANGAHILSIEKENELKYVDSYCESESLTYGCDWSYLEESEVSRFQFRARLFYYRPDKQTAVLNMISKEVKLCQLFQARFTNEIVSKFLVIMQEVTVLGLEYKNSCRCEKDGLIYIELIKAI